MSWWQKQDASAAFYDIQILDWISLIGSPALWNNPVLASHSQACKTDSSCVLGDENNHKHVLVTTVDWTVARLAAITVSLHGLLMLTYTSETVGN